MKTKTMPNPPVERSAAKAARGTAGSTIAAVLISMLFIGIVTASMLKNTSGQSAVSGGYGTALNMHATVNSGLRATESFLTKASNNDNIVNMLNTVWKKQSGHANQTFFDNDKGRITSNQFFKSKLDSVIVENSRVRALISVEGKKSGTGNPMKKAFAFYEVGNLEIDSDLEGSDWSKNALYFGKGSFNGRTNLTVNGPATFGTPKNLDLSNIWNNNDMHALEGQPGTVFNGDVFFDNRARINGASTVFNDKVFFGGAYGSVPNVPNGHTLFKSDVGFEGDFVPGQGITVKTEGNVWLGGIVDTWNNGTMDGDGNNKDFYYANDNLRAPPVNYKTDNYKPDMTRDTIIKKLGIGNYEQRREPDMVLDVAPKRYFSGMIMTTPWSWEPPSGEVLTTFIRNARMNPIYDQYFYPDRATGHFLLEPDWPSGWEAGGTFNEKVILNVNGQLHGTKFYTSTDNASTMIYINKTGQLNNWSMQDNGQFRGLIYIHHENTKDHTWNITENNTVKGAAMFNGGNGISTSATGRLTITHDDDALRDFGMMLRNVATGQYVGESGSSGNSDEKITVVPGAPGVQTTLNPKLLGVYYR